MLDNALHKLLNQKNHRKAGKNRHPPIALHSFINRDAADNRNAECCDDACFKRIAHLALASFTGSDRARNASKTPADGDAP
jgi:hypothetical protein